MKILYILHDFLPYVTAGVEVYGFNLAKELSKKHNVTIMFRKMDSFGKNYRIVNNSYKKVNTVAIEGILKNKYEQSYKCIDLDNIFERLLIEIKPDVVHFHHIQNHSINYIKIINKHQIPIVYTLHDYHLLCPHPRGGQFLYKDIEICTLAEPDKCAECIKHYYNDSGNNTVFDVISFLKNKVLFNLPQGFQKTLKETGITNIKKYLPFNYLNYNPIPNSEDIKLRKNEYKKIIDRINLFLAPSNFIKDFFIKNDLNEKKILFSDYGFIFKKNAVNARTNSDNNYNIGYLGTISYHKGIHILIKAFANLSIKNAKLKIAGDTNTFPNYFSLLKELSIDNNVEFLGKIENDNVYEFLREIDILVLPSLWNENAPLTLREAAICNVLIAGSEIAGIKEIIKNKDFLFEPGDIHALKDILIKGYDLKINEQVVDKNCSPIKSIKENAREMEIIYNKLKNGDSII